MRLIVSFLGIFVVVSSIALVTVRQKNRVEHKTYHALKKQHDEQQDMWRELVLENQTITNPRRVEKKAVEKLGMTAPAPEKIVIVDLR